MKIKFVLIFFLFLHLPLLTSGKNCALTLGNPYIGIKYHFFHKLSLELREIVDYNIYSSLLRGYITIFHTKLFIPYFGLETGYINFDTEGIKGNGNIYSLFIGTDFKITKNIVFATDITYSIITLYYKTYSVSGPELIFNAGLNFYLF